MNRIKSILKEHIWAIVCATFLTILVFAPLLVFPFLKGSNYQGININHFATDAVFYMTRGKEILEGNSLGSPFLREGKSDPDTFAYYSEYILMAPIRALGLSEKINITTIYNVYNFIGVFCLILLIYFFVLRFSGKKLLALAASIFVIGGYSIIYFKTLFFNDFNVYGRVMYPFLASLLLFSYLFLLSKALKSVDKKYLILSGLVFGLMFYIYFFAWAFIMTFNASLFLIYIFKKDFSVVKKIFLISLIGVILGAGTLYKLFSLIGFTEIGKQVAYFNWMSYGREPIFSKIGLLSLIIFLPFFFKKRQDENSPFILAVIMASWICLNQQILTGRMLEYGHFYWYFIVPLSIVIIFYMIWELVNYEKINRYLFLGAIILAFINTIGGQYKSFINELDFKKHEQNFRPIIDVLSRDKTPGVILADEPNEYLFTVFTNHDLFWGTCATLNRVPIQRFKDALFVYYYLNKEARNNFRGYLERVGKNYGARGNNYDYLYRNLEGFWTTPDFYAYIKRVMIKDPELLKKRPEIIDNLTKEYSETILLDGGIDKVLKKYNVNYIVWDKTKNPEWDLSGINGLSLITTYNNIDLYRLN